MTTSRVSRVLRVGALSGVVPVFEPGPNREQAPSDCVSTSAATRRGSGPSSRRGAVARLADCGSPAEAAQREATPCGRRSGLDRMVALLRFRGAVVQLRDREAGLRGVAGQAFLLRGEP